MLYRRLFSVKAMKYAINTVSLIVTLWTACGIIASCFTCILAEKLWHPMLEGGCMDFHWN
ncbi:hypothetical protein N7447_007647 [Penicillium robsamsonii]|uniref:uncharacterized protein n=1 Tax=Penicillium robsamsonii TaxID=1792511 RepID=UPI00254669B0|nr:uncharacterized protein N7447_007647 [Penicillium robsamsonii]KAJ5817639.1 hypothetical protein N7447_007647 [Penicillium robsamsonii]